MTKQEIDKKYREANKEAIAKRAKAYREANKEKITLKQKEYRETNKDFISQSLIKSAKKYNANNKDKVLDRQKKYYAANKEKIKVSRESNKPNANKRIKERKATEPLFKLKTNIRSLIRETINSKGYKKATKSVSILGCTFEQFKLHLESKFEDWMTWDNYGNPKDGIFTPNKTWDIDHIIPVSNALTEQDVINLNHYTNLRPLCSYTNRWVKRNN